MNKKRISIIILIAIALMLVFGDSFKYKAYNHGLLQVVASSDENKSHVKIYDENKLVKFLEDFKLNNIVKIQDMIYYLGNSGLRYQKVDESEKVMNPQSKVTDFKTTIIKAAETNHIYFNVQLNTDKQEMLCHGTMDFLEVNCQKVDVQQIKEIVYQNEELLLLAQGTTDDEKAIVLKKFDRNLEQKSSQILGEAQGNIGMIDAQYIFDIDNKNFIIYDGVGKKLTYDLSEYNLSKEDIQIKDEFSFEGDYYFVTNSNIIRFKDKIFTKMDVATFLNTYLYRDEQYIYFIRGKKLIKYDLSTQEPEKTKIKNRNNKRANNFYIDKSEIAKKS